jgi:hypothetical protein
MNDTVNQLVLDCASKVLRINEMTKAEIMFSINGILSAVECDGYKKGYPNESMHVVDGIEYPIRTYQPLKTWIYLDRADSEQQLRDLLESLSELEKELNGND